MKFSEFIKEDYDLYKLRAAQNIERFSHYAGKKFIVVPGSYFSRRFGEGATGTIHFVGGTNFSYTIDGQTSRKLTYDVKFLPQVVELL